MMTSSKIAKRIEEICKEFDGRVEVVGLRIARLELAKTLAETEAAQQGGHKDETCESCKLQYTSSCPSPRGERCQYFQPRR